MDRNRLTQVLERASNIVKRNDENKGLLEAYKVELAEHLEIYGKSREEYDLTFSAIKVFQAMSDERNLIARMDIEKTINSALQSIFVGENYTIQIDEYNHGSRKHARLLLVNEDGNEVSFKNGAGDGIKQTTSFLANVSLIRFTDSSKLLVLDELFSGFHDVYATIVAQILQKLAEDNDFQFIIVSHSNPFKKCADFIQYNVYKTEAGLQMGCSSAEEVFNEQQN